MPLSRLENFLINTDGNILYVNPSDLDATDSFDNKGNSLTRPFKTIQRALLEAARFAYQSGPANDRFDRTTILLYPGTHLIDNRPGLSVKQNGNAAQYFDINETVVSGDIELTNNSVFDLNNQNNILYKFNSVSGGVIVPKGTSVVGLDLRKTKIKPLYVPDPLDNTVPRSAIFNVTGGCYFWQFSLFDGDRPVYYNKNFAQKTSPAFSHHKLTCFEYADGVNKTTLTGLTDLQQYYFKLMNAYGDDTGVREIVDFPTANDFEPNSPEFKIVGDLVSDQNPILEISSNGLVATVLTEQPHNFTVDDSIRILGISSETYNGGFRVVGVTSERKFNYTLLSDPVDNIVTPSADSKVAVEIDNVTGASPYIFNISLRSVFGMCGMHADGDKATGFKSMVVAQFTGIGLQKDDNAFVIYNDTTGAYDVNDSTAVKNRPLHLNQEAIYKTGYTNFHIKSSNNAVIQAVSVFAIGFAEHFVTENGGDQSITNSNSNFGAKSLIAKGFRKESFDRDDTGYITHIVPPKNLQEEEFNVLWKTLDVNKTVSVGTSSRLYLLDETDESNPPTNITNGFRVGSRDGEILYLDANLNGVNVTFNASVVMQVPAGMSNASSKKEFFVPRAPSGVSNIGISTNNIILSEDHNFFTGESVRVYSDDGVLPDGIEYGELYYVIKTGDTSIKLAKSFNSAVAGDEVDIKNAKGGLLRICSRVTDKIPGDIGHPVQYDSSQNNWFILTDSTIGKNTLWDGLFANQTAIAGNNSSTYIKRISERRDLNDRIYRFRYVIPKEMLNAKAPTKNFVIQESKNTVEESTITDVTDNRNPRIIAGISTAGLVATVTTEKAHKLNIGDRVRIKKVLSTTNPTGLGNTGFNGYHEVTEIPSPITFKFTNTVNGGTFSNAISARNADLPSFERNEYKTTYTIEAVETIQEYVSNLQDGVYYLTVLLGDISPTVTEFNDQKFKQSAYYLYPTVDKDNLDVDPQQSISAASNKLIGEVLVDDAQNSITKEGVIDYFRDNGIGFGITGASCDNQGVVTLNLSHNHNIDGASRVVSIENAGTGYGPGIVTTLFNVPLGNSAGQSGEGATANITVNASGNITAAEIVHPGCAYVPSIATSTTLTVPNGTNGRLNIDVNQAANTGNEIKSIQVVGVGTPGNRNASGYNGTYLISSVSGPKEVQYLRAGTLNHSNLNNGVTTGSNVGVYTGSPNAFAVISGNAATLNLGSCIEGNDPNSAGIATVTTIGGHGFQIGNSIKLDNVTGAAATIYSGKDFIVQRVPTINSFEIKTEYGVDSDALLAKALRNTLSAYGEDTSLTSEKIGGRLITFTGRDTDSLLTAGITTTTTTVLLDDTFGLKKGDFIQIDDEMMRIRTVDNNTQVTVLRGVLGSRSKSHANDSLARPITVIPSEVRRFSSIRASGHTFEYVGYGPGNYSTALPQTQVRVISEEEEFLAISKEEKGGVTFFSGMNDRGEFFTWDGRVKSRETFLGEIGSDATSTFDDLYVRNTLRVGGGTNRNLPSEFRGPVSFTNKITSTSTTGIDAIKLMLKGTSIENPSFQVGPDANPSLIVNQASQFVGIKTAIPAHELDVNGTIRANVYENFKLTDLPNSLTEETTFGRNRILKVNDSGTGYELVDIHEIDSFSLRSYGISNDGTVYSGIATTKSTANAIALAVGSGTTLTSAQIQTKLGSNGATTITGISTSKFFVGEKVKVFGATEASDAALIANPNFAGMTVAKTGSTAGAVKVFYYVAQYHFRNGKVGVAAQIGATAGISVPVVQNFNDLDHVTLNLSRTDSNHGLLVYRQIDSTNSATSPTIDQAKLIGILGPKELGGNTSNIIWKDYGTYDQTAWSQNGSVNEFDADQIHFPNIATTGHRRGWGLGEIIGIEAGSITIDNDLTQYNDSAVGFGTTSAVRVTHDNTFAFSDAIQDTVNSGGNYLTLASGTYLTNKVVLPTGFTLKGNGNNTKLMQQYFATDSDDGQGNSLSFDGNLLGSDAAIPTDITIENLVVDGNSTNNLRFDTDADSYLVYLNKLKSSTMKNFEIRNSPAHGLYIYQSNRVTMEGCAIVDGSMTDRYTYFPLNAQQSTVFRMNDSLFENYSGAVDLSASSVVSTGGNIIRACGTGLRTFASGKIVTTNNIILGPSDEFIPSPDIYDSEYNSVNITVDVQNDFTGPILQYIRDGEPHNISSNKISIVSAGIGTIVNEGTANETLGTKFLNFNIITPDSLPSDFDRENGYIQFGVTQAQIAASTLGFTSAYGYDIIAQEFLEKPVGFTTTVGISSGVWYKNGSPFVGAGVTSYLVTLKDATQFAGISTGNIVKLVNHGVTPSLASYELIVDEKISVNAATKNLRLKLVTPNTSVTSINTGGLETGYISIRDRFTIAKGRVGVI